VCGPTNRWLVLIAPPCARIDRWLVLIVPSYVRTGRMCGQIVRPCVLIGLSRVRIVLRRVRNALPSGPAGEPLVPTSSVRKVRRKDRRRGPNNDRNNRVRSREHARNKARGRSNGHDRKPAVGAVNRTVRSVRERTDDDIVRRTDWLS